MTTQNLCTRVRGDVFATIAFEHMNDVRCEHKRRSTATIARALLRKGLGRWSSRGYIDRAAYLACVRHELKHIATRGLRLWRL